MPRSVPGPSRLPESPAQQASGPSRSQLAIPKQPIPASSPVGQASRPSHPTSTESSFRPSEHTRVATSVPPSSKRTVPRWHMDDQRTERHGESSTAVTPHRAQKSVSRADDS